MKIRKMARNFFAIFELTGASLLHCSLSTSGRTVPGKKEKAIQNSGWHTVIEM